MHSHSTPGRTGCVRCPHCAASVFFICAGGPHTFSCRACRHEVTVELVYDGSRWRTRVMPGK